MTTSPQISNFLLQRSCLPSDAYLRNRSMNLTMAWFLSSSTQHWKAFCGFINFHRIFISKDIRCSQRWKPMSTPNTTFTGTSTSIGSSSPKTSTKTVEEKDFRHIFWIHLKINQDSSSQVSGVKRLTRWGPRFQTSRWSRLGTNLRGFIKHRSE